MTWLLLILWIACGILAWLWLLKDQREFLLLDLIMLPIFCLGGFVYLVLVAIHRIPEVVVWRKKK